MREDGQLLRQYVEERSQKAFAELVNRHVNLVYFAALRRVGGDPHLADDVTQNVFADLARKAPSLKDRAVIAGWLYTSTRFAASQTVRTERRRKTREQEAHAMQEINSPPASDWGRLGPVIDEAMDELSEHEREAVLLRYFENLPLAEVGAKFSLSADAARMRVDRALDKLRGLLAKRGIASTSAALGAIFANQSGVAAPAGLASRIAAGAFSQAGGAAATATLGLGKVLSGIAIGILGIGLVAYETKGGKAAGEPPRSDAEREIVSTPTEASKPAVAAVAAASANLSPLAPAPGADGFDALSTRQRSMLRRLWRIHNTKPDGNSVRWGILFPSTDAGNFDEVRRAFDGLQTDGWIKIGPNGVVVLTVRGIAFCKANEQEIDAAAPQP